MKKILIVGATGFVGNELGLFLCQQGYQVSVLSKKKPKDVTLSFPAKKYQYDENQIPHEAIVESDVIINLAGESISTGRWNKRKKERILKSRIETINTLKEKINSISSEDKLFIQASAIGIYQDNNEPVDENGPHDHDFLAEVVKKLEEETQTIKCQTKIARFGVILGTTGGAFLEMLKPYIMGLGSSLGKNYFSWIHITDVCRAIQFIIESKPQQKIFNITAPNPCTYNQLHEQLKEKYFTWPIQTPHLPLKIMLGEKFSILKAGQILPKHLENSNFQFQYKEIHSALENLLANLPKNSGFYHQKQFFAQPIEEIWPFFSNEKNLEQITPPWLNFKVLNSSTPDIEKNTLINYKLKFHGIPLSWQTLIKEYEPYKKFSDMQKKGPFKIWDHEHKFSSIQGGTLMEDTIYIKLPFGWLGSLFGFFFASRDISKIFAYREKKLKTIFKENE